jgi:acetyl-CoA acetyltransferase family protein
MPHTAYIVSAVRTPGGRKNGRLREWHPVSLGAAALDALIQRAGVDGNLVDDCIFGCVSQNGGQAANIARNCVLASKSLPETCPGTSVDRQCGSSQQAIHFAAQAVMSGVQDVVIAAGVEHMTSVPIGSNVMDGMAAGHGMPFGEENIMAKYGEALSARGQATFSQFEGAEILAERGNVSRERMEQFAEQSHKRAADARRNGYFTREMVPLPGVDKDGNAVTHEHDEGVRDNTNQAGLQKLKPLKQGGRVTAGLASQICDGASAVLIANEAGLKKLRARPRAKIVSLALAGTDPVAMLYGPVPASKTALSRVGLSIKDMDLYEVNEAFASVPLVWAAELGADEAKLHVNGGAIALGHPLGASGGRLMTTLLHELERRGGRYGLQAICEGGGTANATIIEALPQGRL